MSQQVQRHIRVFISSTFRDMQAERDYLVKFIFPQLRKLCEQRDVIWNEVDLRWGITDDQSAEGQVLPICLEEIQLCKPYFIGLLGERYGWIPDAIEPELIEREPWLAEHLHHSVTELEILHGVLNAPNMADHALFYFRDPKFTENMDPIHKKNFIEVPWSEDIEKYGIDEAQKRVEERNAKLEALKQRIRKSGLPLKENYHDPQKLGEWLLEDMSAIINLLFPEGSQPGPLHREAMEHEIFAASRAKIFIGRKKYFVHLDAHAKNSNKPLVVLGESGSGKSALLANWALKYRIEHPEELVLMHYIGATAGSVDWASMISRIMSELQVHFDIKGDIPDDPDKLRSDFPNWLNIASTKGKVVLILDALNQLEDRQGAQELTWLPIFIPENIKLVLSTLPGKALIAVQGRDWPTLDVQPLSPEEREQLVREYLGQYGKHLSSERLKRIISNEQSANPLALRILLEELRQFGVHEDLDEFIDRYLNTSSIPEMFALVLERCELDFEIDRSWLVKDVMSYLWAARRGLSEAELLDLLGSGRKPLSHRIWSPLYLALEQSFLNRGGLLGFFHDYIRQAVENKYLVKEAARIKAHTILADYFEQQEDYSMRKVDELPWQLAQANYWQRLYELLADMDFFQKLFEQSRFDLMAYWAAIESETELKRTKAYIQVVDHPGRYDQHVINWLGHIFNDAGFLEESMKLHKELERICRQIPDPDGLQSTLGNQALIQHARGNLDEAMVLNKEQEQICRQLGNLDGLQRSLGNQANIHLTLEKLDEAMALNKEKEHICRQLGNLDGLRISFGNQANVFYALGNLEKAMALHKEEERICLQLGNMDGLHRSLANQALIFCNWGRLDEAMVLHKEEEHICRQLGNLASLSISLCNQALLLQDWGKLDEAMELHKEEERICHTIGDLDGLQRSLGNQALILYDWGRLDETMIILKENEHICRQLGNQDGLQTSLAIQALILKDKGRLNEALALHREEEQICHQQGNIKALCMSLVNQGAVQEKLGNSTAQVNLVEKAFTLARQNGYFEMAGQIGALYKQIKR